MFTRFAEPRLVCEMQNGIPMIRGGIPGYYVFKKEGKRLLILNRKRHQSILIDQSIDVVVLEINHDEVKLGIICPDSTKIRCEGNHEKAAAFVRV